MNNKDTNRVRMIDSTTDYCDLNTGATGGIPAFATTIAAIKAKMVLINNLNLIGTGTTKGVTTDTNLLRQTMSDLAIKCANATIGYANSIHNNTLKESVNFTRSKMDKLSKEDVDDVCEAIHNAADANSANVANYGAGATDITDLQAAIDLFRTATQKPRQAIISKSQAIKQAITMVREVIDNLLTGQLDVMANTLRYSNKDFWAGYKQAREVLDLGTTTTKVRGTVLDELDVPLKNVKFTIFKTGLPDKVAEVSSDVKGKFNATKLPIGDFDFKWEKDGYKTVTEEGVHIAAGKELKRKIVMDAAFVREGDIKQGEIANINISDLTGDSITKVILTATGNAMRYYATNSPNNGPGGVFIDVQSGQTIFKTPIEFTAQVGFGNGNSFLNVMNIGNGNGHWKITFEI